MTVCINNNIRSYHYSPPLAQRHLSGVVARHGQPRGQQRQPVAAEHHGTAGKALHGRGGLGADQRRLRRNARTHVGDHLSAANTNLLSKGLSAHLHRNDRPSAAKTDLLSQSLPDPHLERDFVHLPDGFLGAGDAVQQLPVVRQQQQAAGLLVETAHARQQRPAAAEPETRNQSA